MRIVHVANIDLTRHMGPGKSVPALAKAQFDGGAHVFLYNARESLITDLATAVRYTLLPDCAQGPVGVLRALSPDVVHFHGVYFPQYLGIGRACRILGIPYVVCPRGSLVVSAVFSGNWAKKWGALLTIFQRFIRGASALHYLTEDEAAASLRFGVPHFVCGNGTDIAGIGRAQRLNRILFVGRMDVWHKGLDRLVRSVAASGNDFRRLSWFVELRGPDHKCGSKRLRRIIERLHVADVVRIGSPVDEREKVGLIASSRAFIHCSRFEGQPQAVLEAMAGGLPVIVSSGSNMQSAVIRSYSGLSFENIVRMGWGRTLRILSDDNEVDAMGANGRLYVNQHARWDRVSAGTLKFYREGLSELH